MKRKLKMKPTIATAILLLISAIAIVLFPTLQQTTISPPEAPTSLPASAQGVAVDVLHTLPVKGKAPKTDYSRAQFGEGWGSERGCDTRNAILRRDLSAITVDASCHVLSGQLNDRYTGKVITFTRGETTSDDVQIDHVVALSNAWQTGAQALTHEQRVQFANDPLELRAVEGEVNQQKSDSDAASWLPPYKPYRCAYVARQIAIKAKYQLWVTAAEKEAMLSVLATCPGQSLAEEEL